MRLRSSQFVFLLLLACSVQLGETPGLRLMARSSLTLAEFHEIAAANNAPHQALPVDRHAKVISLDPQAVALERTPWRMPHPASASTAIVSFTGLLRA